MSDVEQLITSYMAGALSRRTFVRRLLALGVSMDFVETLLGASAKRALAAPPAAMPVRGPYFVMVVLDAFRSDYMNAVPMPNLEWLIGRGTYFPDAWVGQLESYTPASHATLSTGATPAHSGVIGFSWRDPSTGKEDYTGWYDDVIAGRLELQLRQHGVNSIPLAVKAHDPTAKVVALSSEKYYAADAMGGPAADYIIYGLPKNGQIVTKGIPHHVPPDSFLRAAGLTLPWPLHYGEFDNMAMTMAIEALHAFNPRVLMINLPGHDIYGHRVGGPARPEIMARLTSAADRQLGRLIAAYRDRGIFDQTIFVITGDHGMVKNTYEIDDKALKNTIRGAGGDYLFHTGGNSAYIWLRNPAAAARVAQKLVDTYDNAPFAHYLTVEKGVYTYHPVTRTGTTLDGGLEAAHQYLLGTFAGPLAPDISLTFKENTITRLHSKAHGEHGGATWGAQHIPLVITGPGVQRRVQSTFPARLMDVAPTVLALMGIEPTNMDGIVLADCMMGPTTQQVWAQDALWAPLTGYQRTIIARAQADLVAEQAATSGSRAKKP